MHTAANLHSNLESTYKMTDNSKTLWALRIEVLDVAGALTSVSAVFSNSAINIGTIAGCGKAHDENDRSFVTITFMADKSEKQILLRKIERLTKVVDIEQLQGDIEKHRDSVIELSKT